MHMRADSWYAIQTRPKAESLVATFLQQKGYDTFLPKVNHPAPGQRNTRHPRHTPLFPGYLFCRYTEAAMGLIVTTPGVLRLVTCCGIPASISDDELDTIQRTVASGLPLCVTHSLQGGETVEVLSGPLRGCRGIFISGHNGAQLLISITLLQRTIAVEMEHSWVAPARRRAVQEYGYSSSLYGAA